MKRLSALGALLTLFLCSCEPQVYYHTMQVEMRHPSASGLDLSGKSISVAYLDDLSGRDSVFAAYLANGFAQALEKEYFDGQTVIDVYRMEKDMAADYAARDTLVNLAMASGDDVVFLFDAPSFGEISQSDRQVVTGADDADQLVHLSIPYSLQLYAYDTMGADSVKTFKGTSTLKQPLFCKATDSDADLEWLVWKTLDVPGEKTGRKSAGNFLSTWKAESITLVYYDTEGWNKALKSALGGKWSEAMDFWMSQVGGNNIYQSAHAAYNLGVACYLLGDDDLALKWLDRADAESKSSSASTIRARIHARRKK